MSRAPAQERPGNMTRTVTSVSQPVLICRLLPSELAASQLAPTGPMRSLTRRECVVGNTSLTVSCPNRGDESRGKFRIAGQPSEN
jgi:hypothetical protein